MAGRAGENCEKKGVVIHSIIGYESDWSGRGRSPEPAGFVTEEEAKELLSHIKDLESRGFSFESAEASIAIMMRRQQKDYTPPFEMIDYSATVEHRKGRGIFAEAMVKIKVNDEVIHTIAEGNGPVNALDSALRKGLIPIYPEIEHFQLADYNLMSLR